MYSLHICYLQVGFEESGDVTSLCRCLRPLVVQQCLQNLESANTIARLFHRTNQREVKTAYIGLNRPALGRTVPNSTTMSRRPALRLSRFHQPSSFGLDVPHSGVKCLAIQPLSNYFAHQNMFLKKAHFDV